MSIAGEHFVAQRNSLAADNQADTDLETVGTLVARVPVLRQRIGATLPFEISARDVVEKQIVVEVKQIPQAILEVFLYGLLVWQ